jgi:hypothetical protein
MKTDKYKYNINIYDVNMGLIKPLVTFLRMYLLNIYEKIFLYIYDKRQRMYCINTYFCLPLIRFSVLRNKCKYGINIFHKYSNLTNWISSKCLISIGDCYGC